MEDTFRVRLLVPSAPESGAALRQGLRASSRRSHRPTGKSKRQKRTHEWIKLGGKVRALEGAKPMRLQAIGLPQTLDGAQRDADRLGHGAAGPMRGFARRLGTGRRQHFRHHAGRKRRSAWFACLVTQEAVYPFLAVAPLPAPNGRAADSGSASDFGDRQTLRRKENDARPLHMFERTITVAGREQARRRHDLEYRLDERPHAAAGLTYRRGLALLALDLLARIVAARINAVPPFSALFTLWLSMTQAVGLASRSMASRHFA